MAVLMLSFQTCGPSSVSLDDASSSENADDDGIPDEQQEEDEPAIHFAAGGWSGQMGLYVKEWDWDVCGGDMDLDVNDDGTFEGQAIWEAESDWGSREFPAEFEGSIDDVGEVEGAVVLELTWGGGGGQDVEGDLSGDAESKELSIEWVSELSFSGNGGGGSADAEGWADLER